MSDKNAKQQIVDTINDVDNVLVTVNANPSVDELSAALGFTLLLNKMKKHATAVFSGAIPPAITFLDPEKTFENTADSLRDFIIALDKEKADHLRYKVDGDFVKIFITPYRTTITSDDLDFSQGDYNVEAVIAIGVQNESDLDAALTDHGKILHDATVASISIGSLDSTFGSVNWHQGDASSYSELLVGLSDALRTDKSLIDEQIATAFLTGIVAATDRFSNAQTTSSVMTVAAQLMAAGANQQLISTKLEEANEIDTTAPRQPKSSDSSNDLAEGVGEKIDRTSAKKKAKKSDDIGAMSISHELSGDVDEVASQVVEEKQREATAEAEQELAELTKAAPVAAATLPTLDELKAEQAATAAPTVAIAPSAVDVPSFGGTLNATTEQAASDARQAEENDKNHTLLSHGGVSYVGNPPASLPAVNSFSAGPTNDDEPTTVDPFAQSSPVVASALITPSAAPTSALPTLNPISTPFAGQTLADIDAANRHESPHEEARAAIDAAFANSPTLPPVNGPAPVAAPTSALPPLPPLPDFSTLPPLPPMPGAPSPTAMPTPEQTLESLLPPPSAPQTPLQTSPAQPFDPGQFRIPGQ